MAEYREDIPYTVVDSNSSEAERREYWATGAALQATDGLEVSKYAHDMSRDYIAGNITSQALEKNLEEYHEEQPHDDNRQREADIVAARIASLLEGAPFVPGPSSLMAVHKTLFDGIFPQGIGLPGRFRTVNLEKPEPVLAGHSVQYGDYRMIGTLLDYDFAMEADYRYRKPLDMDQIDHFAKFIAGIWQIHPFREGNTRTTAVYSQLYLRSMGCKVDNTPFKDNSELFRDMLVRASYTSIDLGVKQDHSFLSKFYQNVVLGAHNDLNGLDLNVHGIRDEKHDLDYRPPVNPVLPDPQGSDSHDEEER